jgi:putative transposase
VKFALIEAEKASYPVAISCKALGVSRPGYYAWRGRRESARVHDDHRLEVKVRESFERSRKNYGSPRILKDLKAQDEHVSRKRVIRLMQQQGLVARVRRRYKCTTMSDHDQPVAANLLARRFEADRPNQRWVGDTTELRIGDSSRLFLAAILDLHSRFVVGWALSAVNDRHLVLKALDSALRRRCPNAGLLHHSDQGSTYASEDYQNVLSARGITCSMSRRGNCYDNAAMESWFSTVKAELGERFDTYADAKESLFDYVEVFYNQQRRHSSLDYVSPAEYEKTRQAALAA